MSSSPVLRWLFAACLGLAAWPAAALLPIQTWQTSAGARVYFVENHDLPMLDVSVDFPAGSGYDAAQKAGLASLTQHMLRLGAGGLGEDEISRRIADVGAQVGGRFDADRAGLALRTLTSPAELTQALEVFATVLQQPDFPAAAVEREKARVTAAIRESLTQPGSLASRAFSAALYGSHAYGLPASGEIATVAGLSRADLTDFHRRHYVASGAVVAMIGNLSRAEAEAIAEQLTSRLPRGAAPAPTPPVELPAKGGLKVIAHPATQSHLLMGLPVVRREDADLFALLVGNHVLGGGGFVSLITDEVRTKRGLAYSAYSSILPLRQAGPFTIGLQTQRDQAGEALAVVRATLARFLAEGPTDEELANAKRNLVGGFPLRIDSNRKILDYLGLIGFYGLPLTYLEEFVPRVEKVTAEEIRAAFRSRIDPARLMTVVVGADPATLRDGS